MNTLRKSKSEPILQAFAKGREIFGPEPLPSRTIICCFDGTGNKFGENSNVVRLFGALEKDQPEKQIVYYQPGIGTYTKQQYITKTASFIATSVDGAIAHSLDDHVKDGYRFIMHNYRKGDKICIFGFSRGAYTARVVMAMIYKVGILPQQNIQQLDFAFNVYQATGFSGRELSREFKRTFAMPVTVEFVGVWDAVASVGIIPRTHPYTSVNYAVKTFRHALALDEHRARFRPNTWVESTLERQQELDVDEPNFPLRGDIDRDEWTYTPPSRNYADVEEVWFAGCHADVGGGSHHNRVKDSLSYIPLRWMIKEAIVAQSGIQFKYKRLQEFGFDFKGLATELHTLGLDVQKFGLTPSLLQSSPANNEQPTSPMSPAGHISPILKSPQLPMGSTILGSVIQGTLTMLLGHGGVHRIAVALQHARDARDGVSRVYDQLAEAKVWWLLELIPALSTYQEFSGDWIRKRELNLGRGRFIPFSNEGKVKVHKSVQDRMKAKDPLTGKRYVPKAYNWDALTKAQMIQWVS